MHSTLLRPVTWRQHNCARQHRSEEAFIKCAAKSIKLVQGSGEYAVLCIPEAHLYQTLGQAESLARHLDEFGCSCRNSSKRHRVVRIDRSGEWS
jgi:hypothetical protein